MAPPAGTLRVGRYFLTLLAIFVVLYGIVFWPGSSHTPRLGLDLEGGVQIVYQAKLPGGGTPPKSSMSEARDIMEQRVNGLGVSEATVVVQGTDQIVVSIPTKSPKDTQNLGAAAILNFRPVVMPPVPDATAVAAATSGAPAPATGSTTGSAAATGSTTGSPSTSASAPGTSSAPAAANTASSSKSAQDFNAQPLAVGTTTAAAPTTGAATPTPSATPSGSAAPSGTSTAAAKPSADPLAGLGFTIPTTDTAYNTLTSDQQTQLQTAIANFDCSSRPDDIATKTYIACDGTGYVYLLGPVIVPGNQISSASAVNLATSGSSVGGWAVSLNLKSSGQTAWANYTSAHHSSTGNTPPSVTTCSASTTPCAEFVAFTLDGSVISVPHNEAVINGGATQITGSFDQSSAQTLANQLNYGSLPVNFGQPLSQTTVSATLGTSQLKAGLLAGGIGLILVVIYSLIYYRALGLVTIASLIVSGGLTYACLVILGRQIGFTLSLAGIAGFIVAVGITADSFVVFFERIKDEVHEGRSARVAVPRAWVRARRTILSADTVSFLAAAILYYFAAGDVKGFAFTLGLSTILDLVVVFLFTHPLVSLLSRSRAFGSARFTGLNSARAGGMVVSADQLREDREAARRAERGAAKRTRAAQPDDDDVRASSSVAVLDDEDERVDEAAEDEIVDETSTDAETDPTPRTRIAPEPGSAAERAAARRAKLREDAANQKGQR